MKGHKGLKHKGSHHHGAGTDHSAKHHAGANKASKKHMKIGGSVHDKIHDHDGNPNVTKEAKLGNEKGGGHIAGGTSAVMSRKRGGGVHHHHHHGHHGHHKAKGGEVGADHHPFSSAHLGHKHGGKCE